MPRSTFGRPLLLSRLLPRRREALVEGEELIERRSDAAVSSSGVQLGETVGDTLAFADMRRRGRLMCIRLVSAAIEGEGMGCAGPGSTSAGGADAASASGTRNEPESGGVGRCDGGPFGVGEDSALRQLGSTYGFGSQELIGGRQGDCDGALL